MDTRDIVVIGGSSGATAPLKSILGALPSDLPASVFVVLHIPARSLGLLTTVAQAASHLPVRSSEDGMPIEPGHIYLGVPDRHLLLVDGQIRLGRGPRENMARPAIDPLFRSAAMSYGPRVVGVLLSGLLNDGAAGLSAIKRCGGLALVQDQQDAIADEMPLAGLRAVTADLIGASSRLGDVISDLVREPAGPQLSIPPEIRLEVDIAAGERIDSGVLQRVADPAPLICRDCGGALSQVREPGPLRFRCQVGHAFTAEVLATEQESAVDEALRVALRVIEERAELVTRMAADGRNSGRRAVAEMYDERAEEYRRYADTIRRAVLMSMKQVEPRADEGGQDQVS